MHADLRGLPPRLLQVGSIETLLDDPHALTQRAQAAGVPVELEILLGPDVLRRTDEVTVTEKPFLAIEASWSGLELLADMADGRFTTLAPDSSHHVSNASSAQIAGSSGSRSFASARSS